MQLKDLKPAWRQVKVVNAMPGIAATEILSIIERPEGASELKSNRVLFNVIMFIALTVFFQGG